MVPATVTAQIHFHTQHEASVLFESNVSGTNVELVGEIHLLVLFAIRQMSNLDTDASSLARMLATADTAIDSLASGREVGGVRLIRYPGTPGIRQFLARFQFSPDGGASFDAQSNGFGGLAQDLGYYSPAAVTLLLRFFAARRANSPAYLRSLAQAAVACGAAQLGGAISRTNHLPLSLSIMANFVPSAIDEENSPERQVIAALDNLFRDKEHKLLLVYVIQNDEGLLVTATAAGERVFNIWSTEALADKMCHHYPGNHVSRMSFRELLQTLVEMKNGGIGAMSFDRQDSTRVTAIPIDKAIECLNEALASIDEVWKPTPGRDATDASIGTSLTWEQSFREVLEQYLVSERWIALNNRAELYLRHAMQQDHHPKNDGRVADDVENFRISLYLFFFAYSVTLTHELHDEDSPLWEYQSRFYSMELSSYLGLFAELYAARVVAAMRDNPSGVKSTLGLLGMTLKRVDLSGWVKYCNIADNEARFLSELSLRIYLSLAERLGLPQDNASLETAREGSVGVSLLYAIADRHADFHRDSAGVEHVRKVLSPR